MTALSRQNWPIDPSGKNAYYGNPGVGGPDPSWKAQNLVPYQVPWTGRTVMVHTKVRASLDRVLTEYWDEINHDQSVISKYGLTDVQTYNYRANVNNPSVLSNHSYGIAVDIAPNLNPNGTSWHDGGKMLPRRLIELFKFEGWRWGGDFGGTKDPQHFEAVFDQHHDQQPVPAPQSVAPAPTTSMTVPSMSRSVPSLGEDIISLVVRKFVIDKTGIPAEVEQFKSDINYKLAALAAGLKAVADEVQGFTLTPLTPPTSAAIPSLPPLPGLDKPPTPAESQNMQENITATVFGGSGDRNTSAYDGHVITDTEPGCALPYHFSGTRPMVHIMGPHGETTVPIVDVGPWNTNDPYWQTNSRPQAESGHDLHGRVTNHAGIDLTPATASIVGVDGKGLVDFYLIGQGAQSMATGTPVTPAPVVAGPTQADAFLSWVAARLKEPSTYSALAAVGALVAGHALEPGTVQTMTTIGGGLAAVLGIVLSEKK